MQAWLNVVMFLAVLGYWFSLRRWERDLLNLQQSLLDECRLADRVRREINNEFEMLQRMREHHLKQISTKPIVAEKE